MAHGAQASVTPERWRGAPCWVKRYHQVAGFARERAALEAIAATKPGLAPTLLAYDAESLALWLAPAAGRPLAQLPPQRRLTAAGCLGVLLAALDEIPVVVDDLPLSAALERRVAGWLRRAEAVGLHPEPQVLAALAVTPAAFAGQRRSLCHRDLCADHVFVDGDGALQLIDWGQARPDARAFDLAALGDAATGFSRQEAERAFDGYCGAAGGLSGERLRHQRSAALSLRLLASAVMGQAPVGSDRRQRPAPQPKPSPSASQS